MVHECKVTVKLGSILLFVLSLIILGGCAHSLTKKASAETLQACQSNALLQKYHCSLSQVELAARNNDADAQYALGYMYYYGIDTPENMDGAKLWMRRAASQGQPQAIQALQILQISAVEEPPATPVSAKPAQAKTKVVKPVTATKAKTPAVKVSPVVAVPSQAALQGSYSIQLAASVSLPRLKQFVVANHLKGKAGFYKTCMKGTAWYMLIYGHYPNKAAASAALTKLPAGLKKQQPWLKSYKTIQAQVANGKTC